MDTAPTSAKINLPRSAAGESQYWDLFDHLPAAIYTCDAMGRVTSFNEAAALLWGRRPVIGKDLWCGSWKIYKPDGAPLPLEKCPMAEALRTGKPVYGKEIIVERPNGDRFNVLAHPQPLYDNNGVLSGAINMLVDVTNQSQVKTLQKRTAELEKALEELRKSEERYHGMVAEVSDYAIILLSKEGLIENWNKGAENIKGYSEKEVTGKHFRIFYTEEDAENHLPERLLEKASVEGKANHEGWRVRKDGGKFWGSITITALHNQGQEIIGFSKVVRDLSERKESEQQALEFTQELVHRNELLRQSEERYHRMVAEVEDYAILMLDEQGYIQNWNKGAEKIKGYTSEEIIGKHFSVFYSKEDRDQQFPQAFLNTAKKAGKALHEGWRVRKDGTKFWGSVVLTALRDDDVLIGFSKVTRDLTERKIAEEKLMASSVALQKKNKELEKINEDLSSFAYISSHDLQEPLRKIQTFSDRIMELEYDNLSEKGKDILLRMQNGALRMQTLIRDILAYSRTSTSDKAFERTDLNELLAQTRLELEVVIMEKNATIESEPLPTLEVIPFQIQQVFTNLLTNALKFSRNGVAPHIMITCEVVDAETISDFPSEDLKHFYHIAFADNGIGFESKYAHKIFEVFQRLHGRGEFGGTGIGLAIVKKIVENHQGHIQADGRLNEGATFHIYLPTEN